jgi:hypothetical protein
MGDKWDIIESLLEDATRQESLSHLIRAVERIATELRRLDERYGGCDQKAEWILHSQCSDFITYSCTAHLSLMAGTETRLIEAAATTHDCCYVE